MANEVLFAARISSLARFTGEEPVEFVRRYNGLLSHYFNTEMLERILQAVSASERDTVILKNDSKENNSGRDLQCSQSAMLICRAQKVASAESDSSKVAKTTGKNLASVFSRISITEREYELSKFKRHELSAIEPSEKVFPVDQPDMTGRERLVGQFYKEMDFLASMPPEDYPAFSICFDRLSQQYMWCITASDYEGEDISLYDYSKILEAITACLLDCKNAERPYVLVMADFAGIQKYISGISSANHSGVAKRLRARSFYVDMISRVFAQYVIDCFHLSRANILLQTGGKFYCMVPSADADRILGIIRKEIDEHLYHTFHGTVTINMAWLPVSDQELEDYSDAVVKLNDLVAQRRFHPFETILHSSDGWSENSFELYKDLKGRTVCSECGTELIGKETAICDSCKMQISLGGTLPSARYIIYRHRKTPRSYTIFRDYNIELVRRIFPNDSKDAFLIEALNDADVPNAISSLPVLRRYMVNHIPAEENEPKNFETIAAQSAGMTNKLAVLKADVDVLGFIFAQGLRTKTRHFGTISRVATLSRMLDLFFSGYVNRLLCSKAAYTDVYSVFSGGDDLFLIGPWNVMLDLSREINNRFHRFTAENPDVTLSAAVTVFGSKEHISYMAEESEQQLDRAKNEALPQSYLQRTEGNTRNTGRNAICVMGDLFSWDDFSDQLDNAERIAELLNDRKLDVGVLRRILKYSSMYREYLMKDDVWSLMFDPLFYYDRKRNYGDYERDPMIEKWFMRSYVKSMESAFSDLFNRNLFYAQTTIKIALNMTRRERS